MEDRAWFETAVAPCAAELRAYCFRLTDNRWDAEDLYQDVMARTYQHYRSAGEIGQLRALLYTIARNLRTDEHRRKRGRCLNLDEAGDPASCAGPQPFPDYADTRALVEWTAEHLTIREMSMLFLFVVFRYTYREIAEELGCTVSAVRMVLHRSKRTLRASAVTGGPAGKAGSHGEAVDFWTNALLNRAPAVRAVPV